LIYILNKLFNINSWCGPCKMLAPIMKEIVDEDENKVLVKVNIDECRETAQEQKVIKIIL